MSQSRFSLIIQKELITIEFIAQVFLCGCYVTGRKNCHLVRAQERVL